MEKALTEGADNRDSGDQITTGSIEVEGTAIGRNARAEIKRYNEKVNSPSNSIG